MAEWKVLQKPEDKAEKRESPAGKTSSLAGCSYGVMPERGIGLLGGWAQRNAANRISPEITPESLKMHYVSKPAEPSLSADSMDIIQARRLHASADVPVQRIEEEATVETPSAREAERTPNQTGIPDGLKSRFEAMSGLSFDDVRIHYSSEKPAQLQALAYTQGNQVYVGSGQEKHLPHELGHVVQQKQGRVKPTAMLGKVEINDSTALEQEASKLGEQALRYSGELQTEPKCFVGQDEKEVIQMEPHTDFSPRVAVAPPPIPAGPAHAAPAHAAAGLPIAAGPGAGVIGPAPPPPVMVYETFGNNAAQLVNVYTQSCQYPGKTICVMGYNRRYRRSQYAGGAVPASADITGLVHVVPNHELYIIPFKWKAVGNAEVQPAEDHAFAHPPAGKTPEDAAQAAACAVIQGGYDCPYYEIRKQMMDEADSIVAAAGIENVLYRWIDRDATGDTTANLVGVMAGNIPALTSIAQNGLSKYISGAYNWNGQSVSHPNVYTQLNQCEKNLRAVWHRLNRQYHLHSKFFYLPEPVLIMNQAAHYEASSNLQNKINASGDVRQDRESEAAFGNGDSITNVEYTGRLNVTKPIKPGYSPDFEALTANAAIPTIGVLAAALKNLRQSAFDNGQWAFIKQEQYKNWNENILGQPERIHEIELELASDTWTNVNELAQLRLNEARRTQAGLLLAAF